MARGSLGAQSSNIRGRVSTNNVQSAVRDAIGSRDALRIAAGGSWMTAGRPVTATRSLSLSADKGVVEYVADDLTITVRAGTTLAEIAAATAACDQWLPLDPIGAPNGTIGAAIATASSGPLSHSFGLARDFVLGLEFVTGRGDVVRSGGRVVKNVAGFDLMRLTCGAWGTLGVITEATLRLYARPKVDRTFAVPVPSAPEPRLSFLQSLRMSPLAALSMELINRSFAVKLGLPATDSVLLRLAGNANLVAAQLKSLSALPSSAELPSGIWREFSEVASTPSEVAVRLSALPTNLAHPWRSAETLLGGSETGCIHSTFGRGSVRVIASGGAPDVALPETDATQRVAYENLPEKAWSQLSPSVIGDRLSRSVQRAYDPHLLLNPGILG